MKIIICLVFCVFWKYGSAIQITPCHASDRDCLKSSAQLVVPIVASGIPSMGMNSLDPMTVDQVRASQAGLDMDFRNTVVRGLRNCHVIDLRRLGHKTTLDLKCSVTLIGDYTLNGKLLVLPIKGDGKYKIQIHDIVVKVAFNIGERYSKGEKYWTVENWQHTADVLGGVKFQFQNLFNGNRKLADPVIDFANSNWHEIFQEVAPPIVKAIVSQIITETTKLFDKIPIRQLALD